MLGVWGLGFGVGWAPVFLDVLGLKRRESVLLTRGVIYFGREGGAFPDFCLNTSFLPRVFWVWKWFFFWVGR